MISVVVIWTGSIGHSPDDLSTYEQTHHFAHTNVKSAKRTTVARVRRWHGDINVIAVLVNPDESTIEQAREKASSIPTVRRDIDALLVWPWQADLPVPLRRRLRGVDDLADPLTS